MTSPAGCPACGAVLQPHYRFCPVCAAPLADHPAAPRDEAHRDLSAVNVGLGVAGGLGALGCLLALTVVGGDNWPAAVLGLAFCGVFTLSLALHRSPGRALARGLLAVAVLVAIGIVAVIAVVMFVLALCATGGGRFH